MEEFFKVVFLKEGLMGLVVIYFIWKESLPWIKKLRGTYVNYSDFKGLPKKFDEIDLIIKQHEEKDNGRELRTETFRAEQNQINNQLNHSIDHLGRELGGVRRDIEGVRKSVDDVKNILINFKQ